MTKATPDLFQNTMQKTAEIIKEIDSRLELGGELRYSYQILREVLHALRDRLPIDEAVDVAAQLPILMKGIYYDGWKPANTPIKMGKKEFFNRINSNINFPLLTPIEDIVKTVLDVLHKFISSGEMKDIKSILPKSLSEIFPDY